MIEDKLTQDQRIRLEAVAQANQRLANARPYGSAQDLLDVAHMIERYIAGPAAEATTDR